MPHITTSMHRSAARGINEILANSFLRRDISSSVGSVKDSFSSWDKCMEAAYCKWPVIAAIIIGGLIILSIVSCIVRVCCCGMSCCCSCFSFLKCCDCCGDSCAGKKNKPMKHLDSSPFAPSGTQGYQAPAPMMGGALPAKPAAPQYAQFDVGKNGLYVEPKAAPLSEDALPPMPSWDSAANKHVLTEEEKHAVELGELDPKTGQKMPLMAGAAGHGVSTPTSPAGGQDFRPFGARPGQGVGNNGYIGVTSQNYAQNQSAYNGNGRHGSPAPGMGGQQRGELAGNPLRGYDGQDRGFGPDQYVQNKPQGYNGQGQAYELSSPQDSYAQNNGYELHGGAEYGRSQQQRQYSNDQYSQNVRDFPPGNRQYSDSRPSGPGRQYTDRSYASANSQQTGPPRGPSRGPGPNQNLLNGPIPREPSRGPGGSVRVASPALNNNSGFDFGGGAPSYSSRQSPAPEQNYGRPAPQSNNSDYFGNAGTAAPSYSSRSPPPREATYPGYKAYQPANQSRDTPSALSPGGGRNEPQKWDPVQQ